MVQRKALTLNDFLEYLSVLKDKLNPSDNLAKTLGAVIEKLEDDFKSGQDGKSINGVIQKDYKVTISLATFKDLFGLLKKLEDNLKKEVEELEGQNEVLKENFEKAANIIRELLSPGHIFGVFESMEDRGDMGYWLILRDGQKIFSVKVLSEEVENFKKAKKGQYVRATNTQTMDGESKVAFELMDRFDTQGEVKAVIEVIEPDRLKVGGEDGPETIVSVAENVDFSKITPGDTVLISNNGFAVEIVNKVAVSDLLLREDDSSIGWEDVGGQEENIAKLRKEVEIPILDPEASKLFDTDPPKGVTLVGPPGCGKTMMAKAAVNETAKFLREKSGKNIKGYFILVGGPADVLRGIVGHSSGRIKTIFSVAREKAKEGHLVFIIFDEAEALLRTRSGGILDAGVGNTVVTQFNSEMDGVRDLSNVIVFLLTNRQDLIDPAVLRPKRCGDLILKIGRPDTPDKIKEIMLKHFRRPVKIHQKCIDEHGSAEKALEFFIDKTIEECMSPNKKIAELEYKDGTNEVVTLGHLMSGAIIGGIAARAKKEARNRYIESSEENKSQEGLILEDFIFALDVLYEESRLMTPQTKEALGDWLLVKGRKGKEIAEVITEEEGVVEVSKYSGKMQ
ncbi:MAG: hypothetical protein COV29_02340 [Candidatus Yanofskybacteria bacterium CG10_big_fil_rev_8_21_14_0_10_36_16]|uniref:AAA+ ATPase domain-containing protein n=1 Tax=Candidatus Yanofskybacteria bacterium CG10_big_fil_rev_8_21_14_0_10_36_16 TaxID=1975096 RepID=A0A2J0Q7N5_9BACT|nr:MAG: hypothetical protein COV29_02340 [Candidatus Yanofskybacteria bacterium CG10_big_fil_rev_8_21_14_0_10_36_16]